MKKSRLLQWCLIGLTLVGIWPDTMISGQEALGLTIRRRYRRYLRYRKKKRFRFSRQTITVKRLKTRGSIEKKKLKESIQRKLPRISNCISLVRQAAWDQKNAKKRSRYNRYRRYSYSRSKPPPLARTSLQVRLKLNGYGRAVRTRLVTKKLPQSVRDCFSWYLSGKRYYPPESQKSIFVRIGFQISPPKPPKPRRSRFRRKRRRW